jgi:hypothetical protein
MVSCFGVSHSAVLSGAAVAAEFGPEAFNVEFLGEETGVSLQVAVLTDDSWKAGSLNDVFVDMTLTAYWSNVSDVSVTMVSVKVEKQTGGSWKSIGFDISAVQADGLNLQIQKSFQVEPEEAWEVAYLMVETSLSITYSDQREVSLYPFYIPHGRLGPVSIQPGNNPPGLSFTGLMFSPFGLVVIVGILALLTVVIYLLVSRRRVGKSPEGSAQLRTLDDLV